MKNFGNLNKLNNNNNKLGKQYFKMTLKNELKTKIKFKKTYQ